MEKVEILMNWSCNQNCIFCSTADNFGEGKVKPWSEIKEVIDNAAGKADMISFSGGEPTIRKELFRTIKYAKKKDFDEIEVQSNGRMFHREEFLNKIIDLGVTRVLVSIHSHRPKVHDFLTRVEGAFQECIDGLENIKESDLELRYSTVVNKYNYKELKKLAKFLHDNYGLVFSFHFNYVMPQGNAEKGYGNIAPRMSSVKPYLKEAIAYLLERDQRPWIHNIYPCIMGERYEAYMTEIILKQTKLYGPDFECDIDERTYSFRDKPDRCQTCKYSKVCVGPPARYLEEFGRDEFEPLNGETKTHNDINTQSYDSRD